MLSRFQVFTVSVELTAFVHDLLPTLRKQSPNLADQVSRASQAVPLNIAEANRRTGKDRAHRFRIARGENDEVVAALKIAVACRMIGQEDAELGLELADRVGAMLYRLIS